MQVWAKAGQKMAGLDRINPKHAVFCFLGYVK